MPSARLLRVATMIIGHSADGYIFSHEIGHCLSSHNRGRDFLAVFIGREKVDLIGMEAGRNQEEAEETKVELFAQMLYRWASHCLRNRWPCDLGYYSCLPNSGIGGVTISQRPDRTSEHCRIAYHRLTCPHREWHLTPQRLPRCRRPQPPDTDIADIGA